MAYYTLGEVAEYINGRAFKPTEWEEVGRPIIRIQNLNNPEAKNNRTTNQFDEKYLVREGDLLFAWSASLGAHIWQGEDGWLNQHIFKVVPNKETNKMYLYYYLLHIIDELYAKTHGSGMVHITLKPFKATRIFLPSIKVQQQIVDRIEGLLTKLDQAKELAKNALDSFETRKAAILHKAFTGELTAKWRDDNGDFKYDILKSIEIQRLSFCKSQKDRTNILNEFKSSTPKSELPDGWVCLKALLICDFITKGETPTKFVSNKGEVPFLKVYNIRGNKLDFTYEPSFIPKDVHERMKRSKVYPNDVIMNIVGPPLQKVAIVSNEYSEWNINQAIAIFRPVKDVIPKFLYYCLLCEDTLKTVLADTKGVVGQSNISLEQCRDLLIPVPPPIEQKEIVRILDNLFENEEKAKELCDVIDNIEIMKKAILARAFRGELATNEPREESALELLKEVVITQ
ncbi:restriction endonuclease subunit S [Paenibacillus tyrfis]|uniref:restriction endonuclease subunit S n=1 Tax=Paenibacillus tyrfis TaxID=1501230 RepID=UPI000B59067F|nr:restriction endonuclease subunit S [Paenibacillus tyrfis]